jgi:protein-tyrosine-phosphatase
MKIGVVCHGNVARSQVLHLYLCELADRASVPLDLFSCGTAPLDAFPGIDRMLADVQSELRRRGLERRVVRNVFDDEARQHLLSSDLVLVADRERRQELIVLLDGRLPAEKVQLFYEFIGEGPKDFVDTYDAEKGAQDPKRFANCFDELERIAGQAIEKIRRIGLHPSSRSSFDSVDPSQPADGPRSPT